MALSGLCVFFLCVEAYDRTRIVYELTAQSTDALIPRILGREHTTPDDQTKISDVGQSKVPLNCQLRKLRATAINKHKEGETLNP